MTPETKSGEPGASTLPDGIEDVLQLRQHLSVALEVLDAKLLPILPPATGVIAARLRRAILQPEGSNVQLAIARALASNQVQQTAFEGLRIAFARINQPNALQGALVALAELPEPRDRAQRSPALDAMASWLAQFIAQRGAAADADEHAEWRQLSSLCRAVNEQVLLGSEREVMRVFIEALAIWQDLDVRGYSADLGGRFSQDVTLGGADQTIAPRVLDAGVVRDDRAIRRLTEPEIDRFGFARPNVAAATIREAGAASWLLVLIGNLAPAAEARLVVLIDVLAQALGSARAVEMSRLTWALLQRLVSADSIDRAVRTAVDELAAATGRPAALIVTRNDGATLMSAGDMNAIVETSSADLGESLSARHPVVGSHELVLALGAGPPGRALVREQRLVDAAGSLFASWLAAVLRRGESIPDRRGAGKTFDELVDRHIQLAQHAQSDLALVVVGPATTPNAAVVHKCVREIRGRLRAADVVSTVSAAEIGILLPETSFESAVAVARRLQRSFRSDPALAAFATAPVGVASRSGQNLEDSSSLLSAARGRHDLS